MEASYNKKEKLKSKKEIELLFSDGKSISKHPIRLVYRKILKTESKSTIKTGVSVSKRNFKKAVDRNRIKRLLREVYRKNKYIVPKDTAYHLVFLFIYTGREMPDYLVIENKITEILQKFVIQEDILKRD